MPQPMDLNGTEAKMSSSADPGEPESNGDAATDIVVLKSLPSNFSVADEQSANWLIRRMLESRAYAARVKAWAEQEAARAAREERTLVFLFGRQLEAWAKVEIEKLNGRRKSLALPAGTVGFRTVSPGLQVEDEQAVLEWARDNCPAAVTVVEKLSRSLVRQHFEQTGEMPADGARIEPGGEKFFVR